jgi:putative N6-adenine-specific DNA methylase
MSKPRIFASDHSAQAVSTAKANATQAGVAEMIEFAVCDFTKTPLPKSQPYVVLLNPEYGARLGDQEYLTETYSGIGDFFKQRCSGAWGYVFTGNLQLAKYIGLRTKRRIEFQTAQLECRLLEYELYSGSRKQGAGVSTVDRPTGQSAPIETAMRSQS